MTRRRTVSVLNAVAFLVVTGACGQGSRPSAAVPVGVPGFLLGDFRDDYDERHSISASDWFQRPRNHFHIAKWVPEHHYLIAHNDSANTGDGGKWTRIDWVLLAGMPPYEWGFCFSAYDAPSAAAAESVSIARPDAPKTGCNGFPFTRMQRIARLSPLAPARGWVPN